MISHPRALDLAAQRIDFGITAAEQSTLEAHLAACSVCRLEVAEMEHDAARLRRLPPIPPPAWVARAVGRKRRPMAALMLAAALVIGGAIGAAAFVGSTLDDVEASQAPAGPTPTRDFGPRLSPLPRLAGWSPGRDMSTPRLFHTATRLVDGTVLVAGGGLSGQIRATAELYDPATDAFRSVQSMSEPRAGATATLLVDGRVLVAGGGAKSADVYDPILESWTPVGRMTILRRAHAAVRLIDGRVLVVGGSGGAVTRTAEIFDPVGGAWHLVGQMAEAREAATATLLPDGRVLVVGGELVSGRGIVAETVEIFDPVTETFSLAAPMNEPRSRHAATLLEDGRVLVVCGVAGQVVLTSVEIFDPASGSWTMAPPANEAREAFTLTRLPGDVVLIVGGYSQGTNTTELRDPASGSWDLAGNTQSIRGHHTATELLDGRVLVTGGIDWDERTLASTELWLALP